MLDSWALKLKRCKKIKLLQDPFWSKSRSLDFFFFFCSFILFSFYYVPKLQILDLEPLKLSNNLQCQDKNRF